VHVAFVTAGDPDRLTGGHLYNARVRALLCAAGARVDQHIASADAHSHAQRRAARGLEALGERVTEADVVVVDALACLACAPWLADWQATRPLVAMVHELPSVAGDLAAEDLLAAERRLLGADLVVTVSRHGQRILLDHGARADRIRVVSPGCDRIAAAECARAAPGGPPHVLCVAQWIPRKGIDTLIDAWSRMRPANAVLELVGETDADAAYAERVRAAIAAAGDPSIVVRGAVDDLALAAAYRDATFFALPSTYEGYGMAYAEALRHGLPVVACDVATLPELVGREAGILVPPDDPDALARALGALLADSDLRARLSAGALRRAASLPTWQETATAFLAALEDAIALRAAETRAR
jgi:glycosyltransferase involved in cell wall biosynthesis